MLLLRRQIPAVHHLGLRRAVEGDAVAELGADADVVGDGVRVAGVAAVLHHEQDVHVRPRRPVLEERLKLLEALRERVVARQVRAGVQHRLPVGLGPAQGVLHVRRHVVARHQGQRRRAVDRLDVVARQHEDGQRVGLEGLEGADGRVAQMPEQRPVEDRSEAGLSEQARHLVEADGGTQLHAQLREQRRIGIDAGDALLDGPFRPLAPVPADEARLAHLGTRRPVLLQEAPHLLPALPVVADVHDAVGLLAGVPRARRPRLLPPSRRASQPRPDRSRGTGTSPRPAAAAPASAAGWCRRRRRWPPPTPSPGGRRASPGG